MKTDDELWKITEDTLSGKLDALWDKLTPEERRKVFPQIIYEVVEANY